jgi:hypothetical protein
VLIVVVPAVVALCGALAAIVVVGSPTPPDSTPISSAPPADAPPGSQVATVRTVSLDLPPLEVNENWLVTDPSMGQIGVLWVEKEGQDASDLVTEPVAKELYGKFLACFEDKTTPQELYTGKQGCFDELAITSAASTPDPTHVFDAIYALNVARPDVFTVCHNASHKVGELALRRAHAVYGLDTEVIGYLLSTSRSSCMGGVMHGVLDAVGLIATSVEDFSAVVDACLTSAVALLGYCTDAVGHATWDAFGNVDEAAATCALFPGQVSRRECGEGVLMRMYQRLEPTEPYYGGRLADDQVDGWNDEVVAICDSWPSTPFPTAPDEDPREWCWSGSVYLLFKPVFSVIQDNGGDYELAEAGTRERLSKAIASCLEFPAPGDDLCLDRMGPSVGHAAVFDEVRAEELCGLFPTPAASERCLDKARQRIASAFE